MLVSLEKLVGWLLDSFALLATNNKLNKGLKNKEKAFCPSFSLLFFFFVLFLVILFLFYCIVNLYGSCFCLFVLLQIISLKENEDYYYYLWFKLFLLYVL